VLQKQWKQQLDDKLEKVFTKLENEAASGKSGTRKLDKDTLKAVREEVYGLV
jgi:hypothetical protein